MPVHVFGNWNFSSLWDDSSGSWTCIRLGWFVQLVDFIHYPSTFMDSRNYTHLGWSIQLVDFVCVHPYLGTWEISPVLDDPSSLWTLFIIRPILWTQKNFTRLGWFVQLVDFVCVRPHLWTWEISSFLGWSVQFVDFIRIQVEKTVMSECSIVYFEKSTCSLGLKKILEVL